MAIADIKGNRYNKLVALEFSHSHQKNAYWKFQCDCGQVTTLAAHSVKRGDSKSCGCHRREVSRQKATIHGHAANGGQTRLYRIWAAMNRRCDLETHGAYDRYGGRGIHVCAEWANSFQAFEQWAMSSGYSDELSIDRRDNDGGYEPGNCRWVTEKVQANNRSSNRTVIYEGVEMTLASFAELIGLDPNTVAYRLNNGWSIEETATKRQANRDYKR